jgi:hypothetical protein
MRKPTNPAPDERKPGNSDSAAESSPVRQKRRLNLDTPLIPPAGRKLELTNEKIYELIGFP